MGQLARLSYRRLLPDVTLFHATEHLLLPLRGVPSVMTVHDLIFRSLPEHHKPLNRWYLNWTMPLYCRRADHVIAVSEATRGDLVAAYHVPAEKITVIHEAAAPHFQPQPQAAQDRVRAVYGLPERYLLYLGTIEPRKNLERLLAAWAPLYLAAECPPLVIGGKRGWLSGGFFTALEASPAREGVILTGYVAEADLPALYTAATVFVFPSLYEGFGLPILEAMACGTPVICSNVSSMPEAAGEAAVMIDPTDVEALREALQALVSDPERRTGLRALGLKQASGFSWAQTVRETLDVYRLVGA